MKALFIIDPIETLIYDHDTSFALMKSMSFKGVDIFCCQPGEIFYSSETGAGAYATKVNFNDSTLPYTLGNKAEIKAKDFSLALMRKDPPLDSDYLYSTFVLDRFVKEDCLVLNSPESIRNYNEKTAIFEFSDFIPKSFLGASPEAITSFVEEVGGKAILKPLEGFAGKGIVKLDLKDGNYNSLLEMMTFSGKHTVMVQEYLEAAKDGDKRVWLNGTNLIGAIVRVASGDEFRANMRVGAKAQPCDLSDYEKEISISVAKKLLKHGTHLIGLDLIGNKLTEVNITSPTGLQEIEQYYGGGAIDETGDYLIGLRRES